MTLKEVCEALDMNEITIKKAFPRTKKNLEKRGIILTRSKVKGWEYNYQIERRREDK